MVGFLEPFFHESLGLRYLLCLAFERAIWLYKKPGNERDNNDITTQCDPAYTEFGEIRV